MKRGRPKNSGKPFRATRFAVQLTTPSKTGLTFTRERDGMSLTLSGMVNADDEDRVASFLRSFLKSVRAKKVSAR